MRLERSISISAPREVVWNYVTDANNYLEFMDGLTRWECETGEVMEPGNRSSTTGSGPMMPRRR